MSWSSLTSIACTNNHSSQMDFHLRILNHKMKSSHFLILLISRTRIKIRVATQYKRQTKKKLERLQMAFLRYLGHHKTGNWLVLLLPTRVQQPCQSKALAITPRFWQRQPPILRIGQTKFSTTTLLLLKLAFQAPEPLKFPSTSRKIWDSSAQMDTSRLLRGIHSNTSSSKYMLSTWRRHHCQAKYQSSWQPMYTASQFWSSRLQTKGRPRV